MIDTKIQDTPSVLPETLKRCGYKLKQVHRSQYAAIYSVTDIETQQAHGFEVFEVRVQQAKTLPNGIHFAHKECYPNNENFGVWAFAPRTIERAEQIFAQMENKAKIKAVKFDARVAN